MGKHFAILQVAGYQNSGKTVLMEKLISRSATEGLMPASIKHHGHGGRPELTKDSHRHFSAGAAVSGAEGDGVLQLSIRLKDTSLGGLMALYSHFPLDVLFIEGYKNEPFPKVLLLEKKEDEALIHSLKGVICVIGDPDLDITTHLPVFRRDEEEQYLDFIMEEVRRQHEKLSADRKSNFS
ncbi:molybdopterin-guanine dinucleotide biosynthesis protein B [Bacillus mangrovi]|uniref:Molybdopterin-guanine dinucleotide biosynthesis protein B n=1 Tax=Metabacillus mangrovi TaxID=1491830 RepID=A0A7X2S122_9BACI|nr:molybdopterin-guanine dinucleotide biosynthesis protein B [Metabacillus mangrovi]MTH51924.1 molybdopterin-guanine dinucleotide biosynthesis protein B [Metabacillus mangrovi]